ncbi:hypothetical protein [Actibacterium ureilyticum]|uniref:hypothetical protein n=1 Tax=Actibacterium ureilyticum TaxID=1590614 RepID=UPI001140BB20|nr:hypothetical protein [Actibacterium ureilyticum]
MTLTHSCSATILFDAMPVIDYVELVKQLQRPFRNIALEFDEIEVERQSHARFIGKRMSMQIRHDETTVERFQLIAANRPEGATASAEALHDRLHDYKGSLCIRFTEGTEGAAADRIQLQALYHVVRHLLRHYDATLVHWHKTNMLFTKTEFENPTGTPQTAARRDPVKPRRPQAAATRRSARPELTTGAFAEGHMQVAQTMNRLDESFVQAQATGTDTPLPGNATSAQQAAKSWREVFPRLEPSEDTLRSSRQDIFANDLIVAGDDHVEDDSQPADVMEQMVVYVMSLTLMVLMFPVGFAVMFYNIVAGENIRMTARAMALTGVAMGLNMAGLMPALSSLV